MRSTARNWRGAKKCEEVWIRELPAQQGSPEGLDGAAAGAAGGGTRKSLFASNSCLVVP
jgi:hypothetical protein